MKVLKNPIIALLLSAVIVLSSTYLSADVKLAKASAKITDGFYQGVKYDNYKHKSIYEQLDHICGAASGLVTVADNYGIDTEELSGLTGELVNSLSAKSGDISSLYTLYSSFSDALHALMDSLSGAELSGRDRQGTENYIDTVKGAEKMIEEAGYNESVQEYKNDIRPLMDFFVRITKTKLPETFG